MTEKEARESVSCRRLTVRMTAVLAILAVLCVISILALHRISLRAADREAAERLVDIGSQVSDSIVSYIRVCNAISQSHTVRIYMDMEDTYSDSLSLFENQIHLEVGGITNAAGIGRNAAAVFFLNRSLVVTPYQYFTDVNYDILSMIFYDGGLTFDQVAEAQKETIWGAYSYDGRGWIVRKIMNSRGEPGAYMIVEVEFSKLFPQAAEGQLFLVGNDSELIYSSNPSVTNEVYLEALAGARGSRSLTYDGVKYAIAENVFSNISFNIVSAIAPGSFLTHYRELIALGIFALLAGSIVFIFDRERYRVELTLRFESNKTELENSLYALLPYGVGHQLKQLSSTNGAPSERFPFDILTAAGLQADRPFFIVGLAYGDDAREIFNSENRGYGYIRPYFVLNNVLEDTVFDKRAGVLAISDGYFILLAECLDSDGADSFGEIINSVKEVCKKGLDITLFSTKIELITVLGLKETIQAILRDIERISFWQCEDASAEERVTDRKSETVYYNYMSNMRMCLKNADYREAYSLFSQVMDKYLPTDAKNINVAKSRIFIMLDMLSSMTDGLSDSIEKLFEGKSISEIKQVSETIFADITAKYQEEMAGTSTSQKRVDKIKQYIEKHYAENNLNVTTVAEKFGLNPSYLSRMFKENTNTNLLDYIQRIRVEASKELLKTMPVKDVSTGVGFTDVQSFTRVFKKLEGMTPAEFRRLNRK